MGFLSKDIISALERVKVRRKRKFELLRLLNGKKRKSIRWIVKNIDGGVSLPTQIRRIFSSLSVTEL